MVVVAVFLYLVCCVQNTAGDESIILQEMEGSNLTISTGITGVQSDARIQWFYGPEKVKEEILMSQIFMGISGTEISSERFKGRVQLDRISGDLTINNINISDSGLYIIHITAGRLISRTFNLNVYGVQNTAGDESIILQEVEGSDLTISTGITGVQSDARILWFYGPEKVKEEILISQVFMGISGTEISSERFKGRVQLDRSSGDLTINNINISDSGLYTIHIIAERVTSKTFNLSVYAPVLTPKVTINYQTRNNQTKTRTVILGEFCSFMCSVRNGRDVNLSWYEEEKIISVTSNPDLRVSLNLSLNINPANNKTFICVAANPVSNKTVFVNITEICSSKPAVPVYRWIPILVSVLILLLLAAAGVGFWVWREKKKKQEEPESTDTENYAEVNLQYHQAVKKEDNSSVTEKEEPVVYSEVRPKTS